MSVPIPAGIERIARTVQGQYALLLLLDGYPYRHSQGTYLQPMTNRDSIKRLVENITGSLATVQHIAGRYEQHDADIITLSDLNRSAITELQVFSDHIETADEAAAVKPLHDRVHVLVVQLRVLRNTLEGMENAAEKALEDVRRISASVEESSPEDDSL